jgi:hypothetical protein
MADSFDARPRRILPGLINMKYQAITFGPIYAARDPHFMDRFAELMNLSDGTRTVAEIARIVGYEMGPIEPSLVAEMFNDLEKRGFVAMTQPA